MRRMISLMASCLLMLALHVPALAQSTTRALLVACSSFISQEDLGAATSGNLHMVGSALISANIPLGNLSIEDGTIGSVDALDAALVSTFSQADEDDLSIIYLCTHGILSSSDDEEVYLLLGDGHTESPMSSEQLYELICGIQGEKLLIIDACYSGALIGHGLPEIGMLPGSHHMPPENPSPFLLDSSIHVLTSSSGSESSWYYDSEALSTGAVSYFASALSSGLGLYGTAEADLNGDGSVTLDEIHRYLNIAVPSSSSQLLSCRAADIRLPVAQDAMLSRPLSGFSYSASLLRADDPTLDFSFTVMGEGTSVQYRLVDYINGGWDWTNAKAFLDSGDNGDAILSVGRKMRSLSLDGITPDEGGYLMLQVFSMSGSEMLLCSERLIAVQPSVSEAAMTLRCRGNLRHPGQGELLIGTELDVPAELTVSVFDAEGALIRRLAASQLTRPSADKITRLYWDGRDDKGNAVKAGQYTIAAEALIGGKRQKATAEVFVGEG